MTARRPSYAVKLSDARLIELRSDYAAGKTQRELALKYGLSTSHVGRILRGEARQSSKQDILP